MPFLYYSKANKNTVIGCVFVVKLNKKEKKYKGLITLS
jgi:hypothetical protein